MYIASRITNKVVTEGIPQSAHYGIYCRQEYIKTTIKYNTRTSINTTRSYPQPIPCFGHTLSPYQALVIPSAHTMLWSYPQPIPNFEGLLQMYMYTDSNNRRERLSPHLWEGLGMSLALYPDFPRPDFTPKIWARYEVR